MLIVHQSNRVERLVERLAGVVAEPAESVFEPITVVTQNQGMARWLSLQLADRLGVCANLRFPLPARLVWEVFRAVLPDLPEAARQDPEVLAWAIMDCLDDAAGGPEFAQVRAYLREGDDARSFDLATRLAGVLDQYLVYRPDWIRDWESGGGDHWQAELWRRLTARLGAEHWVAAHARFRKALEAGQIDRDALPARIALFGIPALSPGFLEVLRGLGGIIDIHIFLVNPCRQYWGDIVPRRGLARRAGDADPAEVYLETGNPLLASLGQQGAEFIDLLQDCGALEQDAFVEPAGDSLLARIQSDILELRERGADGAPRGEVADSDRSVQVQVCHGPMRELEVLHDQLLHLFDHHPELSPADVMVMAPDIDAYAPYVEAVFGAAEPDQRIPFAIADRPARSESGLVGTFLKLWELPEGRFGAEEVLGLLECPQVQARFGIDEHDLPSLRQWLRDTGIRWGVDGADRQRFGVPGGEANTWRAGLDRLLLGFALIEEGRGLFAGIAPYEDIEGGSARLLGRFLSFAEAVFGLRDDLVGRRLVAAWADIAHGLLERFFRADDANAGEAQLLRRSVEALREGAALAGHTRPVSSEVVQTFLTGRLDTAHGVGGFLSGAVTFCQMVPMRGIPFPVVCLIGMNDGAFPRSRRAPGFDLMAEDFRPGDRSRRDDDRYLFLECLLAARRVLYLSYVGHGIRDDGVVPPSVLVSELLDYVRQGFVAGADGEILDQVMTHHPLQPFSRRNFAGREGLFSYSRSWGEASRALRAPAEGVPAFVPDRLSEPAAEWQEVELDNLIRFFGHPARYLIRNRLGVSLDGDEDVLEESEPFVPGGLEGYGLRTDLLQERLAGGGPDAALEWGRARGVLPHGGVGEVVVAREWRGIEAIAAWVEELAGGELLEPQPVDLQAGDCRLTGWLQGITGSGMLGYRAAKVTGKDWLSLWIRHLALNHAAPDGCERISRWIGLDDKRKARQIVLRPVDEPDRYLSDLLDLYRQGLSRRLPFFPKTSFAYAERAAQGKPDPLASAATQWWGSEWSPGDSQDAYNALAFRDAEPLDAAFERLAMAVFGPMLDHLG